MNGPRTDTGQHRMAAVREIRKSVVVAHSPQHMFSLVNDVESYPQFLPWCSSARVLQRDQDSMVASLDMAMAGLHKRLTTRNLLVPHQRVELRLVEGPFSRFHAVWSFDDVGADDLPQTRVGFHIAYALAGRLLGAALGPVLGVIADGLVDSFSRRADALYGRR
ncbi:MAG TPA: ubiquinone-binding protein [Gammaproteobacteria bacterium]|nr:ubiquinone-binding protein [Gammaproteobacteria bacterium]MCH79251.1 ubiquinone-binding protein [Gammaproteobacteria bacterium]